jgi:chromosome segregation ATPase
MRHISVFLLLAGASALPAQTTDADPRLLQTLVSEVKELRLAIERSTLLGSRTQLAISRLQLQQTAAAQAVRDLDSVRREIGDITAQRTRIEGELKSVEQRAPSLAKPEERAEMEQIMKNMKLQLENLSADVDRRSAREAELSRHAGTLQSLVADAESRIAQMERSLDDAIQQMLKPH